jgi:UDPglucose--hexose-1-phosphate uridylyltransferase
MKVGEIRQNKATKQWVIYAPARRKRPKDYQIFRKKMHVPAHDEKCPFCPGNEKHLPKIIMEVKNSNESWQVRVIPNKFPALTPKRDLTRLCKGIYVFMHGYGHHEVIIETPFHNRPMAKMSAKEVIPIIETYHRRYLDLMKENENMMIIIFRNHGLRAGTSLVHPHSQIIATGMVPHHIRWREEEAQRYFDELGHCVYCDILTYELKDKQRVIHENKSFVTFIPFAADIPFETWIMPKNHKADFGEISDEEKSDLAISLHNILKVLNDKLHDPDYNYVINTSARYRAQQPQLHWYLQISPRLTTTAGFEIGSGMSINPSIPEEDARYLKTKAS